MALRAAKGDEACLVGQGRALRRAPGPATAAEPGAPRGSRPRPTCVFNRVPMGLRATNGDENGFEWEYDDHCRGWQRS